MENRLASKMGMGFGVTCEPFGKDHGAAGGSYATGKEISVLFGDNPPYPLVYEWISLKGQGAMSSSTGNTIGPLGSSRTSSS